MRKFLCLGNALALVLLGFAAEGATPAKKKSAAKKGTKSVATARKKAGISSAKGAPASRKKTTTHSASSRRTRTGRRTTWRNRQLTPTAERYKEIQESLSAKGYLPADQANGKWTDASTAAMKKFQTDQNLDASGKINSLSLIALGLGPKRDASAAIKPPPPAPAQP
ncbi:MAG: peptidoglycan-binding protein [Acidobacteriia bacterium]|nr:peptidoglycan-binding protein [Terriglobia bacterium]